jgi:hypothetical protein
MKSQIKDILPRKNWAINIPGRGFNDTCLSKIIDYCVKKRHKYKGSYTEDDNYQLTVSSKIK